MSFFRDLEEECKPQKILAPEFSSHGTTDAKTAKIIFGPTFENEDYL